MIPATTTGARPDTIEYTGNFIDVDVLEFGGGIAEERAMFSMPMPEDWDLSTVKVKFYWTNAAGASPGDIVEWAIRAVSVSNDDPMDRAFGTTQYILDTLHASEDLHITDATPAITIGEYPVIGDLIHFEIFRNTSGSDDMVEDARLIGCWLQYHKSKVIPEW